MFSCELNEVIVYRAFFPSSTHYQASGGEKAADHLNNLVNFSVTPASLFALSMLRS